ncbi:MAG: glycerol-3-phosphate 1-O-acyltransferase, partial [Pseudomonadota bacterium]
FSSYQVLREQYGEVNLSFGRPIHLDEHLDACHPDWRRESLDRDGKPPWLAQAVDRLAYGILTRINDAASVNAINLVAMAVLASPKNAMSQEDLESHLALYQELLAVLPPSPEMTVTDREPSAIVAHAEKLGAIQRREHELGDVLSCDERGAFLLSYFRNNVSHCATVYSWCACVFMNNMNFSRRELLRMGRVIFPFLKGERFLHHSSQEFVEACERCLDFFLERGLIVATDDPDVLSRAPGGSTEAFHMRLLGHNVFSSLERYYMVVAMLTRAGKGAITSAELEKQCQQTAERLSMLHFMETPDYFDKHLFRNFIRRLKDRGILGSDGEGRLEFDDTLSVVLEDAKKILSKDVRHSILKASPDLPTLEERDAA